MEGNKIKINTTLILWVSFSLYGVLLLLGFVHAFKANYLECADVVSNDLFRTCLENSRAAYGQFGDFIGGMFNPIVGLFTIFLLVSTIKQQSRALDQTESALKHANAALEQNKVAIEQANHALVQNAEALVLARDQLGVMQEEIKAGRIIQKATEVALSEQIKLARTQNASSNYLSHKQDFMTHFEQRSPKKAEFKILSNYHRLHHTIFPYAKYGDTAIPDINITTFYGLVIDLLSAMGQIDDCESETLIKFRKQMADIYIDYMRMSGGAYLMDDTEVSEPIYLVDKYGVQVQQPNIVLKEMIRLNCLMLWDYAYFLSFDVEFEEAGASNALAQLNSAANYFPITSMQSHGLIASGSGNKFISLVQSIAKHAIPEIDDSLNRFIAVRNMRKHGNFLEEMDRDNHQGLGNF